MGELYALDFDGIICDSCGESSLSAIKAARVRWPGLFDGVESTTEDWIVDQMHAVRPVVETGYENVLLVRLLLETRTPSIRKSSVADGLTVEGILENWSKLKPIIMEEWGENRDALMDLFGKVRDEWLEHDFATRQKALYGKHKEKIKRKRLLAPGQEENVQFDASSITAQQNLRERLAPESSSHAIASANKAVSNSVTADRVSSPTMNGPKQEKAKGSSSSSLDDVRVSDGVLIKKKIKRKPELELEGTHVRPEKQACLQGEERSRSLKQSAGLPPKSNIQPTSVPGPEQSS